MDSVGLKIKISSEAELSALRGVESSLVKQVSEARALGKEYQGVAAELAKVQERMSAIKPPPLSFGQKFMGAFKEGIQEIPFVGAFSRAFNGAVPSIGLATLAGTEAVKKGQELVAEGMEFNRLMENSHIALAGAFRSVDPGLSFVEAKQKGGDAIDSLKQKALDLGLNFEALLDTFKVNVPTMWEAGIHDTQQMINLITLLNQVASAKGIDGFQAQRDIIDIMNGMGQRTILGKELEANGVSNETIKAAKEQGTLYDLLTTKLASYGEAGRAAADTQTAAMNRMETAWKSFLGDLTKPFSKDATEGLSAITEKLHEIDPAAKEASQAMADFYKGLSIGNEEANNSPVGSWLKKVGGFIKDSFFGNNPVQKNIGDWANEHINPLTIFSDAGELSRISDETNATDAVTDAIQLKNQQKLKLLRDRGLGFGMKPDVIPELEPLRRMDEMAKDRQDLTDAEQKAYRDQELKNLPPLVQLGAIDRKINETDAWTLDPQRKIEENKDSGQKQSIELTKQRAELEKRINDEAARAAKEASSASEKRAELDLELQINEARVAGNKPLLDLSLIHI